MFVGLHAHSVLVLAADLIEEPVQSVVVTLGVLHQAVPQDVHLLQTQSWETQTHTAAQPPSLHSFLFHVFSLIIQLLLVSNMESGLQTGNVKTGETSQVKFQTLVPTVWLLVSCSLRYKYLNERRGWLNRVKSGEILQETGHIFSSHRETVGALFSVGQLRLHNEVFFSVVPQRLREKTKHSFRVHFQNTVPDRKYSRVCSSEQQTLWTAAACLSNSSRCFVCVTTAWNFKDLKWVDSNKRNKLIFLLIFRVTSF